MSLSPKLLSDSPRRQLPSWSRPCLTKRSLNVGKLSKDALPVSSRGTELTVPEPPSRVHQLEKNIIFLKQQHRDTLQQLHDEIEGLKNQNRELNFKMIMCTCGQVSRGRSTNSRGRRSGGRGHQEAERSRDEGFDREEEIRRLRNALGTEKNKNRHLISVIERRVLEYKKGSSDPSESELSNGETGSTCSGVRPGDQLFLSSRQPTIKECETVIKQLQHQNGQQTHELMQIKADLRDVLYSHKWTPDAFLLARAYIADDTISSEPSQSNSTENTTSLPEVPNKFQNVKIVERAYQRVKEEVTLPALKPKLPATVVADRHRRQQALRTKLSRSVM